MALQRLSQLQKQSLRRLEADEQHTHGGTVRSHPELLQVLPGDKSNISRSLRTLEACEWIVIEGTAGGKAQALYLTPDFSQTGRGAIQEGKIRLFPHWRNGCLGHVSCPWCNAPTRTSAGSACSGTLRGAASLTRWRSLRRKSDAWCRGISRLSS